MRTKKMDKEKLIHFEAGLIPEPIQQWVLDCCNGTESSLNYGAITSIVAISNTIGYRCMVRPKKNTDWLVTPNLWGMLIGPPSSRKSPILKQIFKPIIELQNDSFDMYNKKINALKDEDKISKIYADRYIINDATTEAVGKIMQNNKRTVIQFRDELSGFFSSMSKSSNLQDRAFYLESFEGSNSFTYDRIERGTVHVERLSLGIVGGIQPNVLQKYIFEQEDGLAQRMQLSIFENPKLDNFDYFDYAPNLQAKDQVYNIIKTLVSANFESLGASNFDGQAYFSFDNNSQELYKNWYKNMKFKELNESNIAIQSHLGKYYSLLPALALTFFLIDKIHKKSNLSKIDMASTSLAIEWCKILESHARKMYNLKNESNKLTLKQKIINYVSNNQHILPATFGVLAGNIRGASAPDVQKALEGFAKIEGKTVVSLLSNVQTSKN